MDSNDVIRILEEHKAVIRGTHVVYTSGKHGNAYVNKDAIYPDTRAVSALCEAIAEHFAHRDVEVVAAPAVGGVILSQWVAHHLSARRRGAISVYAEKLEDGSFALRRGYDRLVDGKRVLVVEDILTTGGSVSRVVGAVRRAGGEVVGVGALCNRGRVTAQQIGDTPELYALTEIALDSWDEGSCPLCEEGVPVNTEVGKGREFLLRKKESR